MVSLECMVTDLRWYQIGWNRKINDLGKMIRATAARNDKFIWLEIREISSDGCHGAKGFHDAPACRSKSPCVRRRDFRYSEIGRSLASSDAVSRMQVDPAQSAAKSPEPRTCNSLSFHLVQNVGQVTPRNCSESRVGKTDDRAAGREDVGIWQ